MGLETAIYVVINLVTVGAIYGTMRTQIKYIEKTLERLEKKQDKHNGVIERMTICEEQLKAHKEIIETHIDDSKELSS